MPSELLSCCASFVAGQGNYGYANSVCDMLCMSRRAAGLPALAIAWGPVDHVGYVAEILKVFALPLWPFLNLVDFCGCLIGASGAGQMRFSITLGMPSSGAYC